jgi:predicted transcriptional regulator
MKNDSMTIRQNAVAFLSSQDRLFTALEISTALKIKLSSLSSILKKLVDEDILVRRKRFGPCGGYGYTVQRPKKE